MEMIKFTADAQNCGSITLQFTDGVIHFNDINHALVFDHISHHWKRILDLDIERYLGEDAFSKLVDSNNKIEFIQNCFPEEARIANNLLDCENDLSEPNLYVLSTGFDVLVIADDAFYTVSRLKFISALNGYGEKIKQRLKQSKYELAFFEWDNRFTYSSSDASDYLGVESTVYNKYRADISKSDVNNTVKIAARTASKFLADIDLMRLLNDLATQGAAPNSAFKQATSELDKVNRKCQHSYEIGYGCARKLRRYMSLGGRIDPEGLIKKDFGIPIIDENFVKDIDGFAFITHDEKYGIIINNGGSHSKTPSGRAFSLLHELGHLIISGTLEESFEIKCRTANERAESITNAFAAELILPQSDVKSIAEECSYSLDDIYFRTKKVFSAGYYLTSYQILNAEEIYTELSEADKLRVSKVRSRQL